MEGTRKETTTFLFLLFTYKCHRNISIHCGFLQVLQVLSFQPRLKSRASPGSGPVSRAEGGRGRSGACGAAEVRVLYNLPGPD